MFRQTVSRSLLVWSIYTGGSTLSGHPSVSPSLWRLQCSWPYSSSAARLWCLKVPQFQLNLSTILTVLANSKDRFNDYPNVPLFQLLFYRHIRIWNDHPTIELWAHVTRHITPVGWASASPWSPGVDLPAAKAVSNQGSKSNTSHLACWFCYCKGFLERL